MRNQRTKIKLNKKCIISGTNIKKTHHPPANTSSFGGEGRGGCVGGKKVCH